MQFANLQKEILQPLRDCSSTDETAVAGTTAPAIEATVPNEVNTYGSLDDDDIDDLDIKIK